MSVLSSQILKALRNISAELIGLTATLESLNRQIEAKNAHAHREEQNRNLQPSWLEPILAEHRQAEQDKHKNEDRQYRVQDSMRWATWAGLAAVIIYAGVTLLIWRANSKSAEAAKSASETAARAIHDSEQAFRTDERAWIEIDRIEGTMVAPRDLKFGAVFRYRLYLKNTGKTSAHDVVIRAPRNWSGSVNAESDKDSMRRTQDGIFMNTNPKTGVGQIENPVPKVLAPGTVTVVPFVIDGQEPQVFPKLEWVSYLIGRIDYRDDFGIKHWMKFCFYVGERNGQLWNCHEGNDEDSSPETPP